MDAKTKRALFFTINQLECYVNSDSSSVDLNSLISVDDYIPYWYLANLSNNWKCDSSKNYLYRIYMSMLMAPDTTSSLYKMNEEPIFQLETSETTDIVRFTFERSFDENIIIRVEKLGSKVTMYWKISRKNKYGETLGVKKQGDRAISLEAWGYILELMEVSNFNKLTNIDEDIISGIAVTLDGASWFIEHRKHDYYKAYYVQSPSKKVEMIGLYLLELSEVNYKINRWEPAYLGYNMTLTNDGKYVLSQGVLDTIISYLNQNLNKDIAIKDCCCYFDYYLKFNSNGKLKTAKYPPDMSFFQDKWSAFENRKCRNGIRRTLRKLDLSYLGLKSSLYIFMNVTYDKENQVFRKYSRF